ncbi:helix-turn-helix domain-containing protein [Sedimentibacter sp.]|uniref:TetR/AcrR family transcriptional regulator n=1 Tax=Sedimentibacter sp. TaxID=1960295 RepID=UPI0028AFDD6E|nr:helix-turn-helix domain-containing protein [Sedimentibacter sp.]
MPPKTKFNKENIIEAAFEIVKENGFSAITARSVAKRLGSSVAPIYVNFETIENLIEAVVQRVFAISNELMAKQTGPNIFENIGKASLEFARQYPVLFRELTMQPNQYMASYETVEKSMLEAMDDDEAMLEWTMEERKRLLFKMRVFQTGLSAMVANGHIPPWLNERDVEELLMETGEDLLIVQKIKRGENKQ